MKKNAFICVYNDVDYLDQTIESIKNYFDEIIIVEGAFQITMAGGNPPRSNDGTLDVINKHVDNKKIFLKQVNLREHKHHYQVGLDWCKERGADWGVLVDSDEIWTPLGLTLLGAKIKTADSLGIYEFRVNEFCFINDFNHWYRGQYPRAFKVTPEAFFVADNEVRWKDKTEDRGRLEPHIHLLSPNPVVYHYGYVRTRQRWQLKQDCMIEKDHNPNNLNYKLEGDKYIIPSDIPIYEFKGEHPTIMRSHKFYGKTANDIIYGNK
jgi:glycosyltransferase involved in cell wall biosynthesis